AAVSQREPGSTALYPPALHDALPILDRAIFTPAIKAEVGEHDENVSFDTVAELHGPALAARLRELTLELYERGRAVAEERGILLDRKSTRLNSSHVKISYAVFCLKKK